MTIQVRHSGAWVDNTQEKKRVNGSWVSNEPYKVMKPYISGVPPFTFKSDGENLRDWSMTGQTVQSSTPTPSSPVDVSGVGEKTGNLFNRSGAFFAGAFNNVYTISGLDTSKQYTCSTSLERISGAQAACIYFSQDTSATAVPNGVWAGEEKTFTPNEHGELCVLVRNTAAGGAPAVSDDVIAGNITIMLNAGSTALPYEPYGYCIPITCGGTTTNIYLDAPLMDGDTITKTSTGVDIPTVSGSNTLSVGTTVQPSEMSIESVSQWVEQQ